MKAKNSTILIALCAIMMLAASVLSGCDGGEEYKAKYSYVSVPGRIEIVASADEQSRWMDGYETHSERESWERLCPPATSVREAYNFDLLTRQVCYDCHIFLWTVLIYMTLSVKGKTFDALFETAYVLLYT